MPRSGDGFLLVGHGTRDVAGTEQFFRLADILAASVAPAPVEPCLLELQQPTIGEGWRRLVLRGARHVRVLPLLLFTAGHAREDIPHAIRLAARGTPGVTFSISRPLSRQRQVVNLVLRRVLAAMSPTARQSQDERASGRIGLVMVGRGSHDPCARSDMFVLGEIVRHRLALSRVDTAFYAMATPRLPEALDRTAGRPGIEQVVVYPHLLFEGQVNGAIRDQVADAAARQAPVRFSMAEYLGPEPEVAEALWQRAETADPSAGL